MGCGSDGDDDSIVQVEGDTQVAEFRHDIGIRNFIGSSVGKRLCYKHLFSSRTREREEVARKAAQRLLH